MLMEVIEFLFNHPVATVYFIKQGYELCRFVKSKFVKIDVKDAE